MFTYERGRNGEIILFFCGSFVAACDNWQEIEEEEKLFLEV